MTDEGPRRRRKLSAIMMADVCGFSRMMGENDERTVDLIRDFHRRVEQRVQEFEGRVVDTAGDSVLGEFDSVVNAVHCAQRIQEDLPLLNTQRPSEQHISTRIGVHLGDVIIEDYNVYGDGVNIAARLEPMADPGGICISEAVYQQVRDKLDVPVEDLGLKELKNIQYPVRIFKIAPVDDASPEPPALVRREPAVTKAGEIVRQGQVPAEPAVSSASHWALELSDTGSRILLLVGVVLLSSPVLLFPTAGVLPTGGAILIAIALGRVRYPGQPRFLRALGIGIASGAFFTHWSRLTDVLFLLAGAIVAVSGGRNRESRASRRARRLERRGR